MCQKFNNLDEVNFKVTCDELTHPQNVYKIESMFLSNFANFYICDFKFNLMSFFFKTSQLFVLFDSWYMKLSTQLTI